LGVGLLLFLLTSRERRAWLKLWQVWAGGILALVVFLPNLIWNAEREWLSIAFQGQRLDKYGLNFGFVANFLEYFAGQVLASGVFLFVFVVIAVVLFVRRSALPGREHLALPIFTA